MYSPVLQSFQAIQFLSSGSSPKVFQDHYNSLLDPKNTKGLPNHRKTRALPKYAQLHNSIPGWNLLLEEAEVLLAVINNPQVLLRVSLVLQETTAGLEAIFLNNLNLTLLFKENDPKDDKQVLESDFLGPLLLSAFCDVEFPRQLSLPHTRQRQDTSAVQTPMLAVLYVQEIVQACQATILSD